MWWYIAVFVAALVVGSFLRPKQQSARSAGLDEFNVPTAEVGRNIPVLFGTKKIKSPNIVWYGDLRTVAVKKKGGKK
jgi:hypothetical protein